MSESDVVSAGLVRSKSAAEKKPSHLQWDEENLKENELIQVGYLPLFPCQRKKEGPLTHGLSPLLLIRHLTYTTGYNRKREDQ